MSRRRAALVLVALLALAAAVVLWVRSATDGSRAVRGTPGAVERGGDPASPIDRSRGQTTTVGPDASVGGGPRHGPVRLSPAAVVVDPSAAHGALAGHVISAGTGRGVAGAELTFHHGTRGTSRSASTLADGSFVFAPPIAGRHALVSIHADGYLPFAPQWGDSPLAFDARAGVRVDGVVLRLTPARPYRGLVVSPGGEPVPGARVTLLDSAPREQQLSNVRTTYSTDGDGEFVFAAPDGSIFEAEHPEHGRGRAAVDFGVQATRRMTIQLGALPDGVRADGVIAGRVVTTEGAAVDGAVVRATLHRSPHDGMHPHAVAVADVEGRFRLVGLDPGVYRVVARDGGRATGAVDRVEVGDMDVEVALDADGTIRGVVRDARTGAPVPAFAVVVERPIGPLARRVVATHTELSSEGRFEIGGLARGTYLLTATAHGYAASDEQAATVGSEPVHVELALGRGGRLHGVVRSERDGVPLEGARVSLEGRLGGGNEAVPLLATVSTDGAGRYELSGVAPGLTSVMVEAQDHHARLLAGMSVREGADLEVNVTLSPVQEGEEPTIELAGIGAVLSTSDDVLVIVRVVEGGGAAEVGLASGDAVTSVDGTPVVDLGFGGSINRIRGPEGSTVRLGVRRRGRETVEVVDVPRRRVRAR